MGRGRLDEAAEEIRETLMQQLRKMARTHKRRSDDRADRMDRDGTDVADRDRQLGQTVPAYDPSWVRRQTNEPLYRSDDRPPSVIFQEGFQPRDPSNTDLAHFVRTNQHSNFVSTTTSETLYQEWNSAYRYTIDASGGIDVNATIPNNIFQNEAEIAFPGGLPPSAIVGAHPVVGGQLGDFIPNSGYGGSP